ncbi:related to sen1 protein [Ceraceosorus bombacis]|uniref:Related to sen1 protein n=1 Tax=Ceraceosorus bombacis TaxID=401625 RepID=A0A0N7LA83_9BASI|nr:related to sen1 protein [Ceraceosorus bombacis]
MSDATQASPTPATGAHSGVNGDAAEAASSTRRAEDEAQARSLMGKVIERQKDHSPYSELIPLALAMTGQQEHPLCGRDNPERETREEMEASKELSLELHACMLRVRAFKTIPQVDEWLSRMARAIFSCRDCMDVYIIAKDLARTKYLSAYAPGSLTRFFAAIKQWEVSRSLEILDGKVVKPSGASIDSLTESELYAVVGTIMPCIADPIEERPMAADELLQTVGSNLTSNFVMGRCCPGLLSLALIPGKAETKTENSDMSLREWALMQLSSTDIRPISAKVCVTPTMIRLREFTEKYAGNARSDLLSKFAPSMSDSESSIVPQDASPSPITTADQAASLLSKLGERGGVAQIELLLNQLGQVSRDAPHIWKELGTRQQSAPGSSSASDKSGGGRALVGLASLLDNPDFSDLFQKVGTGDVYSHQWASDFLLSLRGLSSDAPGIGLAFEDALRRLVNFALERQQAAHSSHDAKLAAASMGVTLLQIAMNADLPPRDSSVDLIAMNADLPPRDTSVDLVRVRNDSEPQEATLPQTFTKEPCRDAALKTCALYASTIANLALRGRLPNDSTAIAREDASRLSARKLLAAVYESDARRLENAFAELGTLARGHKSRWASRRRSARRPGGGESVKNPDGPDPAEVYSSAAKDAWPGPVLCSEAWTEGKKAFAAEADAALFLRPLATLSVLVEPSLQTHLLPESREAATEYVEYRQILKTCVLNLGRALRTQRGALASALLEVGDSVRAPQLQRVCQENSDALVCAILSPDVEVHRSSLNVVRATFDESTPRGECLMSLLKFSPDLALKGLDDFLTAFVAATSMLIEANEAARSLVNSFGDVIECLCSPTYGLLRVGSPHSFLPSEQCIVDTRIPPIWNSLLQGIASIFRNSPAWAQIVPAHDMVSWFRDVVLLANDTLECVDVMRAALLDADQQDEIVTALAFPLEEVCSFLRLNDKAILDETKDYVVKALETFRSAKYGTNLPQVVKDKMLNFVESQLAESDSAVRRTLLSSAELVLLRDLLGPIELSDEEGEDEIQVVEAPAKTVDKGKEHFGSRLPTDKELKAPIAGPTAESRVTGARPDGGHAQKLAAAAAAKQASSDTSDSSDDDDREARGLAALKVGGSRSPYKSRMPPAPRQPARSTVIIEHPNTEKIAREKAEQDRKRRLRAPPDFAQLHRAILSWDYWAEGDYPPNSTSDNFKMGLARYNSPEQYKEVFGPLLLLESWAQLQNSKEELTNPSARFFTMEVTGRSKVDGFEDINATIPMGLNQSYNGLKVSFQDTDVVVLTLLDGAQKPKKMLAKVEAHRQIGQGSNVTLRCCLGPLDKQGLSGSLSVKSRWSICKLFTLTTLHRECAALMAFQDYDLVADILQGKAAPKQVVRDSDARQAMDAFQVNRPQAEAIVGSLQADRGISLIQGPPGTGKTKTICSLIARGVDEVNTLVAELKTIRDEKESKSRQLEDARVAGVSGAAVGQLQAEIKALTVKRMNTAEKLDQIKDAKRTKARQQEADRRRVQVEILADADVVCTTLSGAGNPILAGLPFEFETVIIDEAAQAVELSSLIPLRYGCKRVILVGDPNQLPPTVISQKAARLKYSQSLFKAARLKYSQSLFVRIFDAYPDVYLLSIQYRMHPLISAFPSQRFYDGKLQDGPRMAELTKQPWHSTSLLSPFKFFDAYNGSEKMGRGHSIVNRDEAMIAAALYDRRVNVALTRAKSNTFVIGNAQLLRRDDLWGSLVRHAEESGVLEKSPVKRPKLSNGFKDARKHGKGSHSSKSSSRESSASSVRSNSKVAGPSHPKNHASSVSRPACPPDIPAARRDKPPEILAARKDAEGGTEGAARNASANRQQERGRPSEAALKAVFNTKKKRRFAPGA